MKKRQSEPSPQDIYDAAQKGMYWKPFYENGKLIEWKLVDIPKKDCGC
jgi:hypothetical protein